MFCSGTFPKVPWCDVRSVLIKASSIAFYSGSGMIRIRYELLWTQHSNIGPNSELIQERQSNPAWHYWACPPQCYQVKRDLDIVTKALGMAGSHSHRLAQGTTAQSSQVGKNGTLVKDEPFSLYQRPLQAGGQSSLARNICRGWGHPLPSLPMEKLTRDTKPFLNYCLNLGLHEDWCEAELQ